MSTNSDSPSSKRTRRTRADTTLGAPAPKPSSAAAATAATSPSTSSKAKAGTALSSASGSTVATTAVTSPTVKTHGCYPELGNRVTNACRCPQPQFPLKFPMGRNKNVDFHASYTICATCRRRGPEYLCVKCGKGFCEDHVRRHYASDPEHSLFLYHELVRYEEAFYCTKCESFVVVEPFDDFLDAMFVTKGSFVDIPVTHKHVECFENHGISAVSATMQGWRAANEDAHCVYLSMPTLKDFDYIGVFDGHGGPLVARYAGTKLITIFESLVTRGMPGIAQALTQAFVACDAAIQTDGTLTPNETGSCGTTANVVIVDNTENVIYCANAGDARGVLCRGGKAIPLSVDHRPSNPTERDRIIASGSRISEDDRVEGLLAVARAFGDFDFKQAGGLPPERQAVTCVPDVSTTARHKDDEFVVVACDGVWDVLQSQQVVDFISAQLRTHRSPQKAAEALLDRCVAKDVTEDGIGTDNMSVIIMTLK
eukprot:PhM_4_TR216/c0_g1_i1/m.74227/K14803/PTC2_3; protein phosphatase PTC2/3